MRGVHVAVLAVAGLLLGSLASAQGLGDVAAQEKQKRKAEPTQSKVYTETDLGPSMAPVGLPESLPATAEGDEDDGDGKAPDASAQSAASEEDQRAAAEAAWRKKLDRARQEEATYQEVIDRLQTELNDISGGVYNPGRASRIAFLEENKELLAATQEQVAALEREGRANNYR
jgi:hypothetical protein